MKYLVEIRLILSGNFRDLHDQNTPFDGQLLNDDDSATLRML
jgi:hypothetical protein